MDKKKLYLIIGIIVFIGFVFLFFTDETQINQFDNNDKISSHKKQKDNTILSFEKNQKIDKIKNEKKYFDNKITSNRNTKIENKLKDFLTKIKNGQLEQISKEELENIKKYLLTLNQNHSEDYKAILNAYELSVSDDAKIMISNLLGEVGTYESALTLTKILKLDDGTNEKITQANNSAINNLVYDENGNPNQEVSAALLEYYNDTEINQKYKQAVLDSIMTIGSVKEISNIMQKLEQTSDENEIKTISNAMNNIKSEEATSMIFKQAVNDDSSDTLKEASLNALTHIKNDTAVNSLYEWASNQDSTNLENVKKRFETLKKENPSAEMIIKENYFNDKTNFKSDDIKNEIISVFKTSDSKQKQDEKK